MVGMGAAGAVDGAGMVVVDGSAGADGGAGGDAIGSFIGGVVVSGAGVVGAAGSAGGIVVVWAIAAVPLNRAMAQNRVRMISLLTKPQNVAACQNNT
jgi:hypothetical protein